MNCPNQEERYSALQAKCDALQSRSDDYEKALEEIRKAIDPFPQRIAHEVLAKHKEEG